MAILFKSKDNFFFLFTFIVFLRTVISKIFYLRTSSQASISPFLINVSEEASKFNAQLICHVTK